MRTMLGRRALRGVAVLSLVALGSAPAAAANRFFVENKELLAAQTGQTLELRCDNDFAVYGFSMSMKYEPAKLRITKVELVGPWSTPAANNDVWSDLKFDNVAGDLIIGVVYDFSPTGVPASDNTVPVGTNHALIKLTVDALPAATTTTLLDYRDGLGTRQIKNILTNNVAASITPTLVDQTLSIKSLKPDITAVTQNSGKAGATFFATVTNLDVANITIGVEVCAVALIRDDPSGFKLLADKRTLEIVAPACGSNGFQPLKVTTDFGTDTEANGFNYLPPQPPVIAQISGNEGPAGTKFTVLGSNFNKPGLAVKVCAAAAVFTLRADNVTLEITAPACGGLGFAPLEVCTEEGCDTEANGFNYTEPVGQTFVRADTNADGNVDLADAVTIFNDLFLGQPARAKCRDALDTDDSGQLDLTDGIGVLLYLFQGQAAPKPPFPLPGEDPTPTDTLPACLP